MSHSIESIIQSKSQGILSQQLAWENAAQALVSMRLDTVVIERLLTSFDHPNALNRFTALLQSDDEGEAKDSVEAFFDAVNESKFDLQSWLASIDIVARWLLEQKRTSTFSHVQGYVCCSEEASESFPGRNLAEIIEEMLTQYGID